MRLIWERMKQIVEPSASIGLATVLEPKQEMRKLVEEIVKVKKDRNDAKRVEIRIGIVWSGGNVELEKVLRNLEQIEKWECDQLTLARL